MEQSERGIQRVNSIHSHTSTPLYRVYFFGPFRVIRDNQPVGEPVWRRNKAKSLLKWFMLNPGSLFSVDQLTKNFWPGTPKVAAERNFHVAIHYLRHLLEPDLRPRQDARYIRRNKDNLYWFELDENWWADIFDVHTHFVKGKEAEQQKQQAEAISHYRKVVEQCSLGFLHEDAYEDSFSPYRRHYQYIYIEVLEHLMRLYTQADMTDEVLTYAYHALQVDPYCEAAVKAIAFTYFQQGNAAGAIHQLDDFRTLLQTELGIEPGEDILHLRKSMAEHE